MGFGLWLCLGFGSGNWIFAMGTFALQESSQIDFVSSRPQKNESHS